VLFSSASVAIVATIEVANMVARKSRFDFMS